MDFGSVERFGKSNFKKIIMTFIETVIDSIHKKSKEIYENHQDPSKFLVVSLSSKGVQMFKEEIEATYSKPLFYRGDSEICGLPIYESKEQSEPYLILKKI